MIKVGLIGCGGVARHAHLPAWRGCDGVEVVALCDETVAKAESLMNQAGMKCAVYDSLDELLGKEEVDILDICSPGPLHYEHAMTGLEGGANVLIEKPPVMSIKEAEDVIHTAVKSGRKVGAVFNYRYYDFNLEAKRAVDSGLVGKITKIHVVHHAKNVYGESPFLWDEKKSKYLIYDFGIHFLDLMVHIAGPVSEVLYVLPGQSEFTGETTDIAVLLKFANGAFGSFEITSDFTRHSSAVSYFHVYGTAMDLFVRRFPPTVRLAAGIHNPLEILKTEVKGIVGIVAKIVLGRYIAWRNASHKRVIDMYVAWIRGEAEYPMKLSECMDTIRLLSEIESRVPGYAGDSGK